ncbi:uncharacterized protein LOC143916561 [Arctopsyche grandis]|uniref:uncharacterized protein LOC143916561 n=1 Tax=Arctopsyche grandis TaxID=121162 RepID=UPI00406D6434
MECRLCLCSAASLSSASIYDNPGVLVHQIWKCCQLQMKKGDGLPNTICASCETNLKFFTDFKTICIQNNDMLRRKLAESLNIKTEEIILDDLRWEDESNFSTEYRRNEMRAKIEDKNNVIITDPSIKSTNTNKILMCDKDGSSMINERKYSTEKLMYEINVPLMRSSDEFVCDHCRKTFYRKSELRSHISTHNKQSPYKCNVCVKAFRTGVRLRRHMNQHTGEKPHTCETCLKTFIYKSLMLTHMKSHTSERPHKCQVCSKSFKNKYILKEHVKNHTGLKSFKCEVCLKYFTHKRCLNSHSKTHSGKKPYQCDICSKSFACKPYLVVHMDSHDSEKPHKCETCPKSFAYKHRLIRHMKIHSVVQSMYLSNVRSVKNQIL